MPQTGDGNDVERSRRIGALDDLRDALAQELDLPRGQRDSEEITRIRDEISAAERLLEAEEAPDTADTVEAATRTFADLSPAEKREITRGLNQIDYKQKKREEDLKNTLVGLPKEERKAVIEEVKAKRPKK